MGGWLATRKPGGSEFRGAVTFVGRLLRHRLLRWTLFFLPTLLSAVYFFFIAADQYQSEARFVVRSAARPEVAAGLSFLVQLGLARSQDDSFIVQDFMTSRDAIEQLEAKLPLQAMFDRKGADFLARYPSILYGPTKERFYRYFQHMVSVVHVDKTGISTLRVSAFRPEDARDIAKTLLALSEDLVNRINARLRADTVGNSLAELHTAQTRLIDAQAALTSFRNRELTVDPAQNAVALADLIARLSGELATTQAQITEMKATAGSSPQLTSLQHKAAALDEQIAHERLRIAGDAGLATRIAAYEKLTLQREFANRMAAEAEAALVRAKAEAARQLLYLERVVEPHVADYSIKPKRFRDVLTVFAANVLLILVGWLILSGVRDHAA